MVNDFDTSAECRLAEMRSHRNDVDEQMNMVNIFPIFFFENVTFSP